MFKKKYIGILFFFLIGIFSFLFTLEESKTMNVMKEISTLEKAKESGFYLEEYKDIYNQIIYHEQEDFIEDIHEFLRLNYSAQEINEIFEFLNEKNIEKLVNSEKKDVSRYYTISNFEVDKIPRYEAYQEKMKCSLEEAVLKVNIGLDHDFYSQVEDIENRDSYTVLVNKYHSLGEYEPRDLKSLSYDAKYMLREEAANAFEQLVSAATLDGVYLRPYSAYRSFKYQQSLYNTYVNKDGVQEADTYSARPGYSEHQTGLAVDVWSMECNYIKDVDAKWLKENAYQYGFIIRYTKETQSITGYQEEPWHIRYLGKDIAKDVYEKNITFDEYYDLYLK